MPSIWYVREFPTELLTLSSHHPRGFAEKVQWWKDLVADIDKNGMASPVLVDNTGTTPTPYRVKAGNNRTIAGRQLGWEYIPALVFGNKPPVEGIPLTYEEAKEYITDGLLCISPEGGLKLNSAMVPQHGKYPRSEDAYHGKRSK
jgi:hypothetical protein